MSVLFKNRQNRTILQYLNTVEIQKDLKRKKKEEKRKKSIVVVLLALKSTHIIISFDTLESNEIRQEAIQAYAIKYLVRTRHCGNESSCYNQRCDLETHPFSFLILRLVASTEISRISTIPVICVCFGYVVPKL